MRKVRTSVCAIVVLAALSLSLVASASTTASDQITDYMIVATPVGSGSIDIAFSVTGTGIMTNVGAESIIISRKVGTGWTEVASYDRNDDDMIKSKIIKYGNTITYNGLSGITYKIEVTIFAEDSSGYDSRSKEFIVTA